MSGFYARGDLLSMGAITYTREIPDEVAASLEAYIRHPNNQDWEWDEARKMNMPKWKWETVQDFLDDGLSRVLEGPLAMFPTPGMATIKAQREALEAQLRELAKPAKGVQQP